MSCGLLWSYTKKIKNTTKIHKPPPPTQNESVFMQAEPELVLLDFQPHRPDVRVAEHNSVCDG